MSENYEYEIENNSFVVINTKKTRDDKKVICNFTAKIVKMEKHYLDNGQMKNFYCIEGTSETGEALEPIRLSLEEYDKGKWFRNYWGGETKLYDFNDPQNNVSKHVVRAIFELSSKPIPSETVYQQSGIETPKSGGELMYLFGNGAVTSNEIITNCFSNLPAQLSFYRLPEQISSDERNNESIKAVFNLLNLSEKNPYIGLLACLAGFRATISMWLPIEEFIFMVGPKATFKSSTAKILQSFFGPLDSKNCLVGWDSTPSALQDLAIKARNGVLCVDDFVYPESTNRRSEFTNKAHEFLRAVANRSPKSRANNQGHSIECNLSLNCLVISTGEHAPRGVPESLHERGIYFPFNVGDLNLQMLEQQQALAREGTFATANVAFIQHLLANYKMNSNRANKWFEKARKRSKEEFHLSDRAASHMAAYIVGWAFFRKFAVSRGVITEAQSRTYRKHVNKHLGSLMRLQKEIHSPDAGELFVKALRNAFKEGKAFVKDSETGMQPTNVESSKVGWHDNKPQGLWIGWRCPKQHDIFIRDDLDTDELIDLLPEHDKHHFSQGPKTFWKSIKRLKRLNCPESDRNTTRKTFPDANSHNHYHIIMKISDESEVSKKKSRQQEKKYQKSTPETTAETKIKSGILHVETVSVDVFLPDSKFPDFDQTSLNNFVQSDKGYSEFPTESSLAFD